jgi:hypothetical protein
MMSVMPVMRIITMMMVMMMPPIWVVTACISPIRSVEWVVPRIVKSIEIWVVITYRPTIIAIPAIKTAIPIIA